MPNNQEPTSKNRQNGKRFPQRTNSSYAEKCLGNGNKMPSRRKIPMVSNNNVYRAADGGPKNRKEFNGGSQGGHVSRFPLPSKSRNSKKGRMGRMRRSGDGGKRNPKKPYPKKPGGHRLVPQGTPGGDGPGQGLQQWNGPRLVTQGPNHFQPQPNFINPTMNTPGPPRNSTPGHMHMPPPQMLPNGQMGVPMRQPRMFHPGQPDLIHQMPPRPDGMIPQLDPADLKNQISPNDPNNNAKSTNVTNNFINVAQQVVQAGTFGGFMPQMMAFQPVPGPHPDQRWIPYPYPPGHNGPEGMRPPNPGAPPVPFMPVPLAAGPLPQGPYINVPLHMGPGPPPSTEVFTGPGGQPGPPLYFIPAGPHPDSQNPPGTAPPTAGGPEKPERKEQKLQASVEPFVPRTTPAGETETGGEDGEADHGETTAGGEGEAEKDSADWERKNNGPPIPPTNPPPFVLVNGQPPPNPMLHGAVRFAPIPQAFVPPVQVLKPLPLFHPHHPVAFVKHIPMFPHHGPFPPPPPHFQHNHMPPQWIPHQQPVPQPNHGLQSLLNNHVIPPPHITPVKVTKRDPEIRLDDKDRSCKIRLLKNAFSKETLNEWFNVALFHIPWTNPSTTDREIPRLVSWITNPGCSCSYSYAGAHTEPQKKPNWLNELEKIVCQAFGIDTLPDAVNINLYRNQEDCVGWHADDESLFQGLHQECTILSLSLGETRTFQYRLKNSFKDLPEKVDLSSGDLVTMEGLFQRWYVHRVPQEENFCRARINFTWRWILEHRAYCPKSS